MIGLSGCSNTKQKDGKEILISCDDKVVTVSDFNKALTLAKTAYSFEVIQDKDAFKAIKLRILNQLIEEMVLIQMAKEKKIVITDEELNFAIDSIKQDYPEGEFENTLLENVISYETWEKRLKKRLLMEKVVAEVLEPQVTVSPEEIAAYVKAMEGEDGDSGSQADAVSDQEESEGSPADKSGNPIDDEEIILDLKRKKIEDTYKNWINEYKDKYKIEISDAQWSKIIGD